MTTLKRRKTLHFPEEVPTPQPQALAFTNDSKAIAVLTKEPDAFLIIFYFDKAETIVQGRVNAGSNNQVVPKYISCNSSDAGLVVVGGKFEWNFSNYLIFIRHYSQETTRLR